MYLFQIVMEELVCWVIWLVNLVFSPQKYNRFLINHCVVGDFYPAVRIRITSYNVCYTKLLRNKGVAGVDNVPVGKFADWFAKEGDELVNQILRGECFPSAVKAVEMSASVWNSNCKGSDYPSLFKECRSIVITSYSIHYTKLYDFYLLREKGVQSNQNVLFSLSGLLFDV